MQLAKIASSIALALLFSACSINNLSQPKKPKIDNTIEVIDRTSIKTIADINAIAFEWNKVEDPRVIGYHLYRGEVAKDGKKLRHIKTINNRHTTHYLDTDVKPNTKYVYKISSATRDEIESRTTAEYYVSTLSKLDKIPLVQAISNLPRQIKVIWRPHLSQKVNRYVVQRKKENDKEWRDIATVEGRLQAEYIDNKLGDNEIYKYRVIAKTFDNLESRPTVPVKAKTKPLPLGINNLQISQDKPRKIEINWEASKTTDVVRYTVYRSSYDSFGFTPIKNLKSSELSYVDTIEDDGRKFFYKVSATDIDALESDLNITAKMGSTLDKPAKPIITLAQIQGAKAILNWQPGDARAISYTVYKTVSEGFFKSTTIKYTNINDLRFQDEDIQRGVKYSYSIQAVDKYTLESLKTDSTSLILPLLKK